MAGIEASYEPSAAVLTWTSSADALLDPASRRSGTTLFSMKSYSVPVWVRTGMSSTNRTVTVAPRTGAPRGSRSQMYVPAGDRGLEPFDIDQVDVTGRP